MAGFRSLRERLAGAPDPDEVLPRNVLPYMRQPLLDWLDEACAATFEHDEYWTALCQMLKIDYVAMNSHRAAVDAINRDNDLLMDLIDARLRRLRWDYGEVEKLKSTLFLAGSGWQVTESADGLEQVVDETVQSSVKAAIAESQGSASVHLANAWAETYSRAKNPTHAHGEMIRAVESAARPVVTPNDLTATLGKIIGQMESQSALYTTDGASAANDGVGGTIAMMKMLWQQQTDRHGANPTIPATQERVEFLLPIAAALVHAFSTGAVRR